MNEKTRQFFNEIAIDFIHDDSIAINELLDSLKLDRFPRILDLGCGKGIISNKLLERNKGEVIALDISDKMIEYAKKDNPHSKVKFINGDFYEFEVDDPFDMIVCFDAFPHFMDVDNFIKKASSLLKKDGQLIIAHDIGREELNTHHRAFALHVSRMLNDPYIEAKAFEKEFDLILANEGTNYYHIFLKKK